MINHWKPAYVNLHSWDKQSSGIRQRLSRHNAWELGSMCVFAQGCLSVSQPGRPGLQAAGGAALVISEDSETTLSPLLHKHTRSHKILCAASKQSNKMFCTLSFQRPRSRTQTMPQIALQPGPLPMYGFDHHALFNQIRKLMALEVNRSLWKTLVEGKQKDKRKEFSYLHWRFKCFCFRSLMFGNNCTQLGLMVKIERTSGKRLRLERTLSLDWSSKQ